MTLYIGNDEISKKIILENISGGGIDLPEISEITKGKILGNDGSTLSWVDESDYIASEFNQTLDISSVTNCITKIPQDIIVELNSETGVLTVKQGSIYYVPNGNGIFEKKVLSKDVSNTNTSYSNGERYIIISPEEGIDITTVITASDERPSEPSYYWYDKTNNIIKAVTDVDPSTDRPGFSLLLGKVIVENNKITKIDQVFNGFTYFDNMVFALPGVEGLIPNGFDEDGNLDNTPFELKTVLFRSGALNTVDNWIYAINNNNLSVHDSHEFLYNNNYNLNTNSSGEKLYDIPFAIFSTNNGKITSFKINKTLHLPNYDEVVHNTGDENVYGIKTFKDEITAPNQVDYTQITNCITKIPQDIKLELNENMFVLKAGSKVYKGDGTFVDIMNDVTRESQNNTVIFYSLSQNTLSYATFKIMYSGTSAQEPTEGNWVFYNTETNTIYSNDGREFSFPLGYTDNEGNLHLFNGFGYIGSVIYSLPGVEGLIPNGRNNDGSLNNMRFTTSNLSTLTPIYGKKYLIAIDNASNILASSIYTYDFNKNIIFRTDNNKVISAYFCGTFVIDSDGNITSFEPKLPIKLADNQEVVHNTGNEEIAGIKTFKDEITAPNQVDYTQITNCITKIPQDIKLELSDGTLTLKAGSICYKCDGNFTKYITSQDFSRKPAVSAQLFMYIDENNNFAEYFVDRFFSGDSAPSVSTTTAFWFDTTVKKMKKTMDNGNSWFESNISLPMVLVTCDATQGITSIDQVFNGCGFIGNTIFSLPEVEGLIPNGRNEDGSLNNTKFKTSNVLIQTRGITGSNNPLVLNSNIFSNYAVANYDKNTNYNYASNGAIINYAISGIWSADSSGRIISVNFKNVFQIIDKNDTDWIGLQSKPSNKYVDLTLGATGSSYTAPANGWVWLRMMAKNASEYVELAGQVGAIAWSQAADNTLEVSIPVKKSSQFIAYYSVTGNKEWFRFIYDEGAK